MDIWLVLVLLSEDGGRELEALAIDMEPTKLDRFVEGKLGAGEDTNCRRVTYWIGNNSRTLASAAIDDDMLANMTCTCPPSKSTSAGLRRDKERARD